MALIDIDWQVDWLQFRVDFDSSHDPFKYCKSLVESLGYSIEQRQRSLRFYDTSFSVVSSSNPDDSEFSFHFMRSKPNSVMVLATSEKAKRYNVLLSSYFNDLSCKISLIRVDYAHDFKGDFDQYDEKIRAFASKNVSRTGKVQDSCEYLYNGDLVKCDASTRVIPSYESRGATGCFSRLYEKGKQMEGDPLWLRQEFEIKPGKFNAIKGFSFECWHMHCRGDYSSLISFSGWASLYCTKILDNFISFKPPERKQEPPLFSSFLHLVKQYAKVFNSVSEHVDMSRFNELMISANELKELGSGDCIDDLVRDFYESSGTKIRIRQSDIQTLSNSREEAVFSLPDGSLFKYFKLPGRVLYASSSKTDFVHMIDETRSVADVKRYIVAFKNDELFGLTR